MSAPAIISSGTAAGGPPVGGGGTSSPSTIPRWTGPSTLGDSVITQDANARAIGVGVTPNASWPAAYRAIQLGQTAAWMAASGGVNDSWLMSNSYWDGASFRYLGNGPALAYAHAATGHRWLYSGSGSAGSAFSFTDGMILNTSGYVGIGTASPTSTTDIWGLQANTGATSASVPTGTMRVAYAGAAAAGNFGSSVVFTQRWASANAQQVAVGQITGVKIAGDGNYGGGLAFFTSNGTGNDLAERARIDSAGRLLVGTSTAPSSASVRMVVAAASGGGQWHSNGLGGCALVPSTNVAQWYVYPGAVGSEGYLASVKLTETGLDVTTASATPGIKLPNAPANTDPNTLDSYREGTRTLAAGDLSGWTYVTATQYWTLVGRTVTLHTVFTGGTSSATGGATIATPPLLTPLRIAAGAAVNSSGTALGNGVCVVTSTSSTTGTVITSNAISSSAVDKVITVTYETSGL